MRTILALAIALVIIGCTNENNYQITGTVDNNLDGKTIYVSHLTANNASEKIDSTTITNGKFSINPDEIDLQHLAFLNIEGTQINLPFIAENTPIMINIDRDSLQNSKVSGSENNKIFKTYINHILDTNKDIYKNRMALREAQVAQDSSKVSNLVDEQKNIVEEDKAFKRSLLEKHPNSIVAAMVLTDFMNTKSIPNPEIRTLYQNLNDDVKATSFGKNLDRILASVSATEIGAKAPGFEGPTPDGSTLALEDALGKVTILDFWASWCKPCRIENPNVVKVYNKYHDKGLNIVGISLDKSNAKERWLQAIEDDGLTWQHISHLEFWQDPIAKKYNVRAIPATFILDENGVIIAKNLRGDALEEKMAELLN